MTWQTSLQADFYPRPPRGGRPLIQSRLDETKIISIHALREEGDHDAVSGGLHFLYFYPRPPRGGRLAALRDAHDFTRFLSTPSARRATSRWRVAPGCHAISIHALREEGDSSAVAHRSCPFHFYPRPPRGGRPASQQYALALHIISIHALREEGDAKISDTTLGRDVFLSTPSARRATAHKSVERKSAPFLSTPSARRATSSPPPGHRWSRYFYPRPPRGGRPSSTTKSILSS